MYVLVVGYMNGSQDFYGPFKTKERAEEYAKILEENNKEMVTNHIISWWFVSALIVPLRETQLARSIAQ